jgi:5,10-methylenetetrahydrofolate reductase
MSFRLILEIAPPRQPDLGKVVRQIELFGPLVDAILVPDNSLGTAAMSSIVLGLEVRRRGMPPVVALNARDRNHIRLESDFITLRASGIEEVLLLYGDAVDRGRSDLTVREMLGCPAGEGLRRGVAATAGRRLGWKGGADFLVSKLDFGRADLAEWRRATGFRGPVYGGVLALADEAMTRKVCEGVAGLDPPKDLLDAFAREGEAGFRHAIGLLEHLMRTGVDGAHLVVPGRWRRFAEILGEWIAARDGRARGTVAADAPAPPTVVRAPAPPASSESPIRLEGREPVPVGRAVRSGSEGGPRSRPQPGTGAPGGLR